MEKERTIWINDRRGVAIIMVLGLLAVLMIAAMAFSISMRVERQGAASFRNSMQSRHMLFAALGRAMEDINGQMVTSNSFKIFPPDAVLGSRGEGVFTNEDTRARLLTRKALEFLPDDLADNVMSTPAYWHTIENSEGTIVGRYSFVAADCSGWIDINHAGGLDRLRGVSPAEIQIDGIDGVRDAAALLNERDNYPFETFRELTAFGDAEGFLSATNVKDLFTFSLSPVGEFLHNGTNLRSQVYIGTNRSEWSEEDILSAFEECTMRADYDAGLAYSNLLDYIDEDLVPTNLADGHVDMAPMLNEVVFCYTLHVETNGQYSMPHGFEPVMQLECMYPFREFSGESYSLEYELSFEKKDANTHDELIPDDMSGAETFGASEQYNRRDIYGEDKNGNVDTNDFDLNFTAELKIRLKESTSSSNLVDQVPYPDFSGSAGFVFEVDREVSAGDHFTITNWFECVDPRFNGSADNVASWIPGKTIKMFYGVDKPTIGKDNTVTLAVFDSDEAAYDPKADGDTALHIANTNLQTVGELGYICLDRPWHTIGLYKHAEWSDYDHVLDWFTTREKGFQKGLVNINSFNTNALAAVFTYVPLKEYDPVFPLPDRQIDQGVAEEIANEIWSNGPYTNVSELGRLDWGDSVSGDEIDREAPIRNSVELLTTRQNIFTIILAADSYAEPVGGLREGHYGSVRARARAVAVVWRDPWPDAGGKHRYFLRYFDVLRE